MITQEKILEETTEVDVYVPSDSIKGKLYRVQKNEAGIWTCTCPADFWGKKKNPNYICKHAKRVAAEIEEKVAGRML